VILSATIGTVPRVHASGDRVRYGRAAGRKSLSEMGFFGSGQFHGGELPAISGAPRQPIVCTAAGPQEDSTKRWARWHGIWRRPPSTC